MGAPQASLGSCHGGEKWKFPSLGSPHGGEKWKFPSLGSPHGGEKWKFPSLGSPHKGKSENSLAWGASTGGKSEKFPSLGSPHGGKSENSLAWGAPTGGGKWKFLAWGLGSPHGGKPPWAPLTDRNKHGHPTRSGVNSGSFHSYVAVYQRVNGFHRFLTWVDHPIENPSKIHQKNIGWSFKIPYFNSWLVVTGTMEFFWVSIQLGIRIPADHY